MSPEKRAEMTRKAVATKKANKEAAKERERAAYAKAYEAKVSELAAKLGAPADLHGHGRGRRPGRG
jgi:hypothetical protein